MIIKKLYEYSKKHKVINSKYLKFIFAEFIDNGAVTDETERKSGFGSFFKIRIDLPTYDERSGSIVEYDQYISNLRKYSDKISEFEKDLDICIKRALDDTDYKIRCKYSTWNTGRRTVDVIFY